MNNWTLYARRRIFSPAKWIGRTATTASAKQGLAPEQEAETWLDAEVDELLRAAAAMSGWLFER